MELELNRVDYTLVGITLQNAMKVLPAKKAKEQQKFVIGDQDGVVQLLTAKKDEASVLFKTVPGNRITSVQLGGSAGAINDKIFVASEHQITGYNKKGKVFLSFDTNLTEPIKSLVVTGNDLIVCGNHVYTHYKDCKESGSYLCGDTIVDCNVLCPNNVCEGQVDASRVLCNSYLPDYPNNYGVGVLRSSASSAGTLPSQEGNRAGKHPDGAVCAKEHAGQQNHRRLLGRACDAVPDQPHAYRRFVKVEF